MYEDVEARIRDITYAVRKNPGHTTSWYIQHHLRVMYVTVTWYNDFFTAEGRGLIHADTVGRNTVWYPSISTPKEG